jgi:hypothetical protein
MESHDEDKVLSLRRDAGVSLRLDKCHFFRRRVNYLGHVCFLAEKLIMTNLVSEAIDARCGDCV